MSVQIAFPKSESTLFNDYVQSGYEASFGSYDVNEDAHTVTHHVVGSITRGLVGKDLTRVYQFSDGHLIIKSSRSDTLVSYVGALLTDLQTPLTFGKKALRRRTNAKTETWKKQSGSIRYRTGLHGTELWPRASGREAAGDLAD